MSHSILETSKTCFFKQGEFLGMLRALIAAWMIDFFNSFLHTPMGHMVVSEEGIEIWHGKSGREKFPLT